MRSLKELFGSRPSHIELWQSNKNEKWYFHLRSRNGRVRAPSQGYTTKSNAIRAVVRDFPQYDFIEIDDPNNLKLVIDE